MFLRTGKTSVASWRLATGFDSATYLETSSWPRSLCLSGAWPRNNGHGRITNHTSVSVWRYLYPDTHPFRYHISNLRHTILQRNLIHNHYRQRGEHRERFKRRLRSPNRNKHTESPVAVGTENSGYSQPRGQLSQRFKTVCQPEGPAN